MKRLLLAAATGLFTLLLIQPAAAQTKKQLVKWGQDCINKRNWECAENAYRKLLEKETDDRQLSVCYNNLGFVCSETGRRSEAMEYYTAAAEKDPKNWRAHSNIALILHADQRYSDALPYYTKAIENGADDKIRRERASVYFSLGMWDEAIADYEYLTGKNPADYRLFQNLAVTLLNSGDNRKAVEYADKAISINDRYAAGYVTKGIALLNLKDKASAKEAFEKATELGSDNPRLPELLEKCD